MNSVSREITSKTNPICLFDLDGTLYPNANPYRDHVRHRVWSFMSEVLGVPEPVEPVWREIFTKYHQSEKGLRESGYDFDVAEYWSYIRKDVDKFINKNGDLRKVLLKLRNEGNCELYIFTNCRENEAKECLVALGIDDLFPVENLIGASFMNPHCKPEPRVFEAVSEWLVGNKKCQLTTQPIYFFEDSYKNLKQANEFGWKSVFIISDGIEEEGVSNENMNMMTSVISEINEEQIREKLPELLGLN